MEQNFKTIANFPNYEINQFGNIKNKTTGKILQNFINNSYYKINLHHNKKAKSLYVHILIATYFIPNPLNLPEINHKDGNKLNYSLDNLEWCTSSENSLHAYLNKLQKSKKGIENTLSKKVIQNDLSGNFIKMWDSVMDIERETGIKNGAISNCCLGKSKTSSNFIWKYINN
jgi:hypothetical protein